MGQNFLHDKSILRAIAEAGLTIPVDTIVEVGPGTGNLTEQLLEVYPKVIAIEKDHDLIPILQERFASQSGLHLIHEDIMTWNPPENMGAYGVIANIPYYITTPIIKKFLEDMDEKPAFLILLVQKEFAQKACAIPPDMSSFGAYLRAFGDVKTIRNVSRNYFTPAPKVDSSILRIVPHTQPEQGFLRFIQRAHSMPRKKISNALGMRSSLPDVAALLQKRASELDIPDLQMLYAATKTL